MNTTAGRPVRAAMALLVLAALATPACGGSPPTSHGVVPPEFRAACGRPGTHVTVRKVPVTIRHADCDLTGTVITYPGFGGVTVPRGSTSIGTSSGLTLIVHPGTLDVTISATGPPGNA